MIRKRTIAYRDIGLAAVEALGANRLRSGLTAASMAAAVAAVVLVATVAASGTAFVIAQIEGVGANLVYAYYEAGGNVSAAEADYIQLADVDAVRARLGVLATAVAGVTTSWDSIAVDGEPMQVRILGSSEEYRVVRNLEIRDGRFLEREDLQSRAKVCLVTPRLAGRIFGSPSAAVGGTLELHGLRFQIVGVFAERTETFGQSEVSDHSVVVPYTVLRYFQRVERVDPLYVSARDHEDVDEAVRIVRETLAARHRPGSLYRVEALSGLLATARRILLAMSLAMVLVASITLAVSGLFIMNMMLIAVSERTREIGVRRAVGATRREIRLQFLFEALAISLAGGFCGSLVAVVVPWSVSTIWPSLPVHVPAAWAAAAVLLAAATGAAFSLLPASRAATLDPVEALRHD